MPQADPTLQVERDHFNSLSSGRRDNDTNNIIFTLIIKNGSSGIMESGNGLLGPCNKPILEPMLAFSAYRTVYAVVVKNICDYILYLSLYITMEIGPF